MNQKGNEKILNNSYSKQQRNKISGDFKLLEKIETFSEIDLSETDYA